MKTADYSKLGGSTDRYREASKEREEKKRTPVLGMNSFNPPCISLYVSGGWRMARHDSASLFLRSPVVSRPFELGGPLWEFASAPSDKYRHRGSRM